jgi:hypothetical protein
MMHAVSSEPLIAGFAITPIRSAETEDPCAIRERECNRVRDCLLAVPRPSAYVDVRRRPSHLLVDGFGRYVNIALWSISTAQRVPATGIRNANITRDY